MIKKHFDFIELMNPPVHHNMHLSEKDVKIQREPFYDKMKTRITIKNKKTFV